MSRWRAVEIALIASADRKRRRPVETGLRFGMKVSSGDFADHLHGNVGQHVGVRRHRHGVVASHLEGAVGHAHLRLQDGETHLRQAVSNVGVGDRAEQPAIDTGLLADAHDLTRQLLLQRLRSGQFLGSGLFQIGAARLGSRRIVALADRYGIDSLEAAFDQILHNTAEIFRREILRQIEIETELLQALAA